MQGSKAYKSLKWRRLESPRRSYDALLLRIRDNLGERDLESFKFAFRNGELPTTVLEDRKPLQWFTELENRGLLSPDDLSRLENFLDLASLNLLLEDVRHFQAKQRVVTFFQRGVEAKIPELCLDEKFNQSWVLNKELSRNFLKRCEELFRGIDNGKVTVKILRSLLSRGVKLLVNSCRPCSDDVDYVAMKILYLSDIFIKKFGKTIIEHKDMLSQLLPASPRSFRPVNCRKNSTDVLCGPREFESKRLLSEIRSSTHFDYEWFVVGITLCLPYFMPLINWLKRVINDKFCY